MNKSLTLKERKLRYQEQVRLSDRNMRAGILELIWRGRCLIKTPWGKLWWIGK